MVSPGELRLVSAIYDEPDKITKPTISVDNSVKYPLAEAIVDKQDLPIIGTLDSLSKKNILNKIFYRKGYVCPSCNIERMGYSRACPECGSIHTIGRVVARHSKCGHIAPASEFKQDGNQHACPDCNHNLCMSEIEYDEKHSCKNCGIVFSQPQHQVQCRVCLNTFLPKQVTERTLYEYRLTNHGRAWYHIHMMTREQAYEWFQQRNYTTDLDTSVSVGTTLYPLHVYADHNTFDMQIVAGICDSIHSYDISRLQTTAKYIEATPILIATVRNFPKHAVRNLQYKQIGLLTVQPDGTLGRDYSICDDFSDCK